MASFRRTEVKRSDDGTEVALFQDRNDGSWFAGKAGGAFPLGAFSSAEAARRWADQAFPGGEWRPACIKRETRGAASSLPNT
jgi:hypothetical protein